MSLIFPQLFSVEGEIALEILLPEGPDILFCSGISIRRKPWNILLPEETHVPINKSQRPWKVASKRKVWKGFYMVVAFIASVL